MASAVILAAGRGSRLAPLTDEVPKCMVPFRGRPMIEWQLGSLHAAGVDDIHVVTGYRREAFEDYDVTAWHNPEWDNTNMVASLMCCRALLEGLKDDILILYSDLVYEPRLISIILEASSTGFELLVDLDWLKLWSLRMDDPLTDAETLNFDSQNNLLDIGRKPQSVEEIQAQYIGIMKLTPRAAHQLLEFWDSAGDAPDWALGRCRTKAYMTDLIRGMTRMGYSWKTVFTKGGWLEVDTFEDLSRYAAHLDRDEGASKVINVAALRSV